MQKELVLQFPKRKEVSLTLLSAITHSQSFRGYHNASLLQGPRVSLTVAPFLGAPRRWSVSSSTRWSRIWLGTGPGPYLILWPFLVSWSRGMGVQRVGTPVRKRIQNTVRWHASLFVLGFLAPAQLSHQSGGSRGWCGWNFTGASRSVAKTSTWETTHHTRRVGELRFITLAGPEELTLQALSPKQRGYRVFYTRTGMIKQVCGFPRAREIAKSRKRVSEISSSS